MPMAPSDHEASERPRIRLLPPALANRIAAGEVVERPASVVKELCENSLDAGARVIEVEVEGGGAALIRVRDDGVGIPPEEAPLALERHATSKIRDASDLDAIATLGFRGEALPSIAAVSRFVLQTRARGHDEGVRVEVEGGSPAVVRAAGCPPGTLLEVRDLFFNTPARRKFLKSAPTEAGHAVEAVARLALAFHEVDFRVRVDGREALVAPRAGDLVTRAAQVLTREVSKHLYPCEVEEGSVRVHGLVGDPSRARGRPDAIYTFVNGRFVRDRLLQHAIQAAYLPVLDRGRYPWVVLFVDLPARAVDVNVHPAKLEVRFADGRAIHRAVEHAVSRTLGLAPWVAAPVRTYRLSAAGPVEPVPAAPPPDAPDTLAPDTTSRHAPDAPDTLAPDTTSRHAPDALAFPAAERPASAAFPLFARDVPRTYQPSPAPVAVPERRPGATGPDAPGYFSSLRVVGQAHRLYIVCEGPDEIVLVDQHAAHERIHFERLRASFAQGTLPAQPLLFPATLDLGPLEREAAETWAPELARLGFDLEPFGEGSVALRSAPAILSERDARETAREMLAELARVGRASALDERLDALLATVACHAAVRAGDPLSAAECEALLRELDGVGFRGNCPHGRPVLLRARVGELERGFGRR